MDTLVFCTVLLIKAIASSAQDVITVGMESTSLTLKEGDGAIQICAVLLGNQLIDHDVRITLGYQDGSAKAGVDYFAKPQVLVFNQRKRRSCIPVTIVDDMDPEASEEFYIKLTSDNSDVFFNPQMTTVIVEDNDGSPLSTIVLPPEVVEAIYTTPRNSCEGLNDFISSSKESCMVDMSESTCHSVFCYLGHWEIRLILPQCESIKGGFSIWNKNSSVGYVDGMYLTSDARVHGRNLTVADVNIPVELMFAPIQTEHALYYVIKLDIPFFDISFPTAAISVACEAECQPLPPIEHGKVTIKRSVATYSCEEGYELEGENTRNCQSDLTWSGKEPHCKSSGAYALMESIYGYYAITVVAAIFLQLDAFDKLLAVRI